MFSIFGLAYSLLGFSLLSSASSFFLLSGLRTFSVFDFDMVGYYGTAAPLKIIMIAGLANSI